MILDIILSTKNAPFKRKLNSTIIAMSSNNHYFHPTFEIEDPYSSIFSVGSSGKFSRNDSSELRYPITLRNKSAIVIEIKIMINKPPEQSMAERHRS